MNAADFVARVRRSGEAAITPADLAAFRYRPGAGRAVRSQVVELLLPQHSRADLPTLRALIREEIHARREHEGCGRVLLALATMLSAVGAHEDVLLVHAAKFANMDAGATIDRGLLRMGSREELAAAVRRHLERHPEVADWSLERVLQDLDAASSDAATHDEALERARHLLDSAWAEDTLDEEDEEDEEDEDDDG